MLSKAQGVADIQNAAVSRLRIALELARCFRRRGDPGKARALIAPYSDLVEKLGDSRTRLQHMSSDGEVNSQQIVSPSIGVGGTRSKGSFSNNRNALKLQNRLCDTTMSLRLPRSLASGRVV